MYNKVESGIKILEHLYKIEPMALADVNTDRIVKELFIAYYLNDDYQKCNELFAQIHEHDFREWLIYVDIKTKQNIEYLKDVWFISGLDKYKDINRKKEISLFHLNNKELSINLLNLSNNL